MRSVRFNGPIHRINDHTTHRLRRAMEIVLRRAQPGDKRTVEDLCRRIWGRHDYLPEVFDEWVRDRRGGLWLASIDDRVVGVAKLTLLGDREAWLHALRVDPRCRRRGVATALVAHRLDRAKRLGARVARLDTGDDNIAVQRLARRFAFRRVGRYTFWRRRARVGPVPRSAVAADLNALERLALTGDGLLHERFARRALDRKDLARAIRRHDCLVAGRLGRPLAMAIVDRTSLPAGTRSGAALERLRVLHLGGSGQGLRSLLAALPAEAARRGLQNVGIPAQARHWPALRALQYRRPWPDSMLLFEKTI